MNKSFLELWQCDISTRNIVTTTDSVSFRIDEPIIENYFSNDDTNVTKDMKVYVWILRNPCTPMSEKSPIKVVAPGEEVTFEKLDFGKCKIEGCVSYRNRYNGIKMNFISFVHLFRLHYDYFEQLMKI